MTGSGAANQWRMVDLLRPDARAHALRHKELGGWVNHPVFFGEEVPRRLYFPSGPWSSLLNVCDSDRPLCRCKKCRAFGACTLRESGCKSLLWHPDQSMRIRLQLWRLWVRLPSIEYFGDGLASVRCQSRYEDQRLDSLAGVRGYHSAGISVRYQDHGAMGVFERAIEGCRVIRQGRQGYWGCQDIPSFG